MSAEKMNIKDDMDKLDLPLYGSIMFITSTDKPVGTENLLYPPQRQHTHAPSSSLSSLHSVSLSSDRDPSIATFPVELDRTTHNHEADDISLTESYENLSTASLASPTMERIITLDWQKAKRKSIPPKLPNRPNSIKSPVTKPPKSSLPPPPPYPIRRVASGSRSTPSSPIIKPTLSTTSLSSPFTASYTPRRVAPPPPPSRSSDRSSIVSTTTTYNLSSSSQSHQSRNPNPPLIKRPTPVPLVARKRYELVFNANIIQRRKAEKIKLQEKPLLLSVTEARSRRAVGWRGLSVDLLTANDVPQRLEHGNGSAIDDIIGPDEKLEGPIIRRIWKRSGLDNSRLAEIW